MSPRRAPAVLGGGRELTQGLREVELSVSASPGGCSIDCTRIAAITPILLHHLALVYERSVKAGVPVHLMGASPALEQVFAALAPGSVAAPSGSHSVIDVRGGLVQASEQGIKQAVGGLIAHLKRMHVPDLTAYVLRTLFEEVATNATLHAQLPQDSELFWHLQLLPHKSVFVFADCGAPFDPTAWDSECGPVDREPGDDRPPFGIRLIQSLAQRFEYKRIDNQLNLLIVERNRR